MAAQRIRLKKPGWKLQTRTCVVCSQEFKRRKRGNDAQLCCSRECGFHLIRDRAAKIRAVKLIKAEFARWARRSKPKPAAKPVPLRRCRCGEALAKGKSYCPPCRKQQKLKSNRSSSCRRADKAYRKAMSRGLVAGSEKFDPLEILVRDAWHCHICGDSTPKRLFAGHTMTVLLSLNISCRLHWVADTQG
jgi:hypothetical protein